jgi:chloramphenicol-sensitive protein RarD
MKIPLEALPTTPMKEQSCITDERHHSTSELRKGVAFGLAAYFWWGFFPIYFKTVAQIPPLEVVAHRIFWSLIFLLILVSWTGQWTTTRKTLTSRHTLLTLACTTLLIAVNWLVFIYAVGRGQVLQSSLGYFINPLVNVLLGFFVLGERLRRMQIVSLFMAVGGVLYLTLQYGSVPWISLILAGSFGLYGLLRKTAKVDALVGLTVETLLLGPLAFAYIYYLHATGKGAFLAGFQSFNLLLPLAGILTAIPLLLFNGATRRLRLATIGFLQYITPSMHFLLAVWVYGETFTTVHLLSFVLIWSGLALYSWDAVLTAHTAMKIRLPNYEN